MYVCLCECVCAMIEEVYVIVIGFSTNLVGIVFRQCFLFA